jgi:hypothetical protein
MSGRWAAPAAARALAVAHQAGHVVHDGCHRQAFHRLLQPQLQLGAAVHGGQQGLVLALAGDAHPRGSAALLVWPMRSAQIAQALVGVGAGGRRAARRRVMNSSMVCRPLQRASRSSPMRVAPGAW